MAKIQVNCLSERLDQHVKNFLTTHNPQPLDDALSRKVDRIVKYAEHELR